MSASAIPTTELGIANIALNHLGQKKIAAIDTTTELGRKIDLAYMPAVYETLRDIKPNFAKKRAIFHHVVQAEKTISGATAASPVVITVAAHGFSTGDTIAIWDVGGMTDLNGKRYNVTVLSSSTFSLADESDNDVDGSEFDAYTTGGKCGLVAAPPEFGFSYRYALPSDYIVMCEINGNDKLDMDHSIENGELLINDAEVKARYIYANTDVSKWDIDFLTLCTFKVAEFIAVAVTNLRSMAGDMQSKYAGKKAEAKGTKSQESGTNSGPQRKAVCDQWTSSRNGN